MTSPFESVKCESIKFAINNFTTVANTPEFLNFSADNIYEIINADDLNIDIEVDVFKAIKRWYEHDKNARKDHLSLLMTSLRFIQFDPGFIRIFIKSLPGCDQVANEALRCITETFNTNHRCSPLHKKVRIERKCRLVILNDVKKLKYILRYNLAAGKWQKCFELKLIDYSYGLIYNENSFFFIGGRSRGIQRNNTVKRLDLKTLKWTEMSKMSQRRDDLCVVMLNEKMYAFGGHDGGEPFNTVEMFDICKNTWQILPTMSDHKYGASAIVYESCIYVFGGLGIDCEPLKSVEFYNPTTNCWTKCSRMHEARGWPGVTILNGFIFVIGGFNEGIMHTVERFDPQQNIWTRVAPLNVARFGICAITVDNRVWAVGGHDVYTVEEYNADDDKWIEKASLPIYGIYSYVEVPNSVVNRMQTQYLYTLSANK